MKKELQRRSKQFAIAVVKLVAFLPEGQPGWTIKGQIVRSATSVAANYRAVCRAKSDKDFISKMGTVIEECDETLFWLEMIEELDILSENSSTINPQSEITKLKQEANELTAIFVASVKTVKKRLNRNK